MVLNLTNSFNIIQQQKYNPNMNYFGTLSPPSSTGDSSEGNMTSPASSQFSPGQYIYNATEAIELDHDAFANQIIPKLVIIEQPLDKFRFRYKSEMTGTHGTLTGQSSDRLRKATYPTVQLINYSGPAIIRCGLYQIDNTNPHPHRLVSKDSRDDEKDDPHEQLVSEENNYVAIFSGMGIIHTAKKHIPTEMYKKLKNMTLDQLKLKGENRNLTITEDAKLKERAEYEVRTVNLNTVRLGFDAYRIEDNKITKICGPIFSQGINNLKSAQTGELRIVRMDFVTTSCRGGQEIFMLVEKVVKNNIKIRFYETDENDTEIWEAWGKFNPSDVHHQYAIVFKAPPYKRQDIEDTVQVLVELVRHSDGARSESKPFKYKPCERQGRKRARINESESLSSSELPATLGHLSNISLNESNPFDQTFFEKADNINSAEFNGMLASVMNDPDYMNLLTDTSDINLFNKTDGPVTPSTSSSTSTMFVSERIMLHAKKIVKELGILVKKKEDPKKMENYITEIFTYKKEEGNNALHTSIICEQYEAFRYICVLLNKMTYLNIANLKNDEEETPLHLAVQYILNENLEKVISLLLAVGADAALVNKNGNNPLHCAIEKNNLDKCKELINPDTIKKENDAGDTPLFLAVQKNNLGYLKLLMKYKPDINATHAKTGDTLLHIAVDQGFKEIAFYLLSLPEIRVDIQNYKGLTAVAHAKNLIREDQCSIPPDVSNIEIFEKLNKFVIEKGIYIKEEMEDDDEEDEDELAFKLEPESEDEYKMEVENSGSQFSDKLIDLLGKELDNTETLQNLLRDLDYPPLTGTITTKMLFTFLNVSNVPVTKVKDLLEKYGAKNCVEYINNLSS